MKKTYLVGLREIYVNTIKVEIDENASNSEIIQTALNVTDLGELEYSHTLDAEHITIHKV